MKVLVYTCGAEMCSVKKNQREYLWQGDPKSWNASAPWLFPFVGRLKHDSYYWNGRRFFMPMHGFISKMDFEAERIGEYKLQLTLHETKESLHYYPWRFRLTFTYSLEEDALCILADVHNCDVQTMYFSLGAHPGFLCEKGDQLLFHCTQSLSYLRPNAETHLLDLDKQDYAGPEICLDPTLFERDAMIFPQPNIQAVTLRRQNGANLIYSFDPVPYLGIWSHDQSNMRYVCVEPWHGVDDTVNANADLTTKEAIYRLASEKHFQTHYRIEPSGINF